MSLTSKRHTGLLTDRHADKNKDRFSQKWHWNSESGLPFYSRRRYKIDSGAKGSYRTAVYGATQFKTQTLTGEERKLSNEVIHHLNYSRSIIRNTKLRMRCVGNVACIGKRKTNTWFYGKTSKENDHLKDLHVDGSFILKWIINKIVYGPDWFGTEWGHWGGVSEWVTICSNRTYVPLLFHWRDKNKSWYTLNDCHEFQTCWIVYKDAQKEIQRERGIREKKLRFWEASINSVVPQISRIASRPVKLKMKKS